MAEETPANQTPPAASAAGQRELTETEKMVQEALAEAQASLSQMQQEADKIGAPAAVAMPGAGAGGAGGAAAPQDIELLSDVDLQVTIELGRTQMLVEDVLHLGEGSVVELDKLAGDPVDVYVNQRLIARGEVLVLNDNFCIRISEIVANLDEEAGELAEQKPTHGATGAPQARV